MTDTIQPNDPAVTALTAKAGDKVDNYTIMEQVGVGGTAVVFRGHDHVLNRNVAIKQLMVPPGEAGDEIRQRALAESQIHKRAAALDARLLVQYIDTINDRRGLFLISEYIDGPSLEWILQQETGPMEQRQALGIVAATAKALGALHQAGMVHRDLKPSNILMPREGGLKLADFGLAAIIAEQQSLDVGSVRYMAPETLQGEPATPKSDLYSLGMIAYEMLAGRENFNEAFRTILRDQRNQSMRWVKWHTNVRAKVSPLNQLVDSIPDSLSQLVARMMEKDPARRVGSANELIDAIRSHFAAGSQGTPAPTPHAAMAPPRIDDASQTAQIPRRSKLPMILVGTLVVWVIAIGGFLLWKNQQDKQASAQRVAALIDDIKAADDLILDQEFEAARDAFAKIPVDHKRELNPSKPGFREDLIEAGKLKAQALLSAQNNNFRAAYDNASGYEKLMRRHASQNTSFNISLSVSNAEKLTAEYNKRRAMQKQLDDIQALLDQSQMDRAIESIRLTRNDMTDKTAAEDFARMDQLEALYNRLIDDQRITALIAEARKLQGEDKLDDAIELLEDEAQRKGDQVDPRITQTLGTLNRDDMLRRLDLQITKAERSGDDDDLLAALRDKQREEPSQDLAKRINELEIRMLIRDAEEARNEGRHERAEEILSGILERDPDNTVAKQILASIGDSKSMNEAVRLGDENLANAQYAQAIKQYKIALQYGADSDGKINEKIRNATGSLHQQNSEAALGSGDYEKAQGELEMAKLQLGETGALRDLQSRIDQLRDYTTLVSEGDALIANKSFGKAKAKYLAAKKIFDRPAIDAKISDCDFGLWLEQCDQAISNYNWEEAEGALKRAEAIKINDQTRARREKIETHTR